MQEGRSPDPEWWDDSLASANDPVVSAVALGVLGAGLGSLFGLPVLNLIDFWVIFAIGYAVVVPLVSLLRGQTGGTSRSSGSADRERRERVTDTAGSGDTAAEGVDAALDHLRDRYARGDLSDEQFERKLEALLETETPEDARARVGQTAGSDARDDTDREVERER
jgi:hypothetical protein